MKIYRAFNDVEKWAKPRYFRSKAFAKKAGYPICEPVEFGLNKQEIVDLITSEVEAITARYGVVGTERAPAIRPTAAKPPEPEKLVATRLLEYELSEEGRKRYAEDVRRKQSDDAAKNAGTHHTSRPWELPKEIA